MGNRQDDECGRRSMMIAPLLDFISGSNGDPMARRAFNARIREQAVRFGVSASTVRRWFNRFKADKADGLKTVYKGNCRFKSGEAAEAWGEIVASAGEIRAAQPMASVAEIIYTLESERPELRGKIKRSTLQRHLQKMGMAHSDMILREDREAGTYGSFQRDRPMDLVQGDIKVPPKDIVADASGRALQTYIIAWVDDCTRFMLSCEACATQSQIIVNNTLRSVLLSYRRPGAILVDNGKVYRSRVLARACSALGIKLLHARPYAGYQKGKIERINKDLDSMILPLTGPGHKTVTFEGLRRYLAAWVDKHNNTPNSALGGRTPAEAFALDPQAGRPTPGIASLAREAFRDVQERKVSKIGTVSCCGEKYSVPEGEARMGERIEVCIEHDCGAMAADSREIPVKIMMLRKDGSMIELEKEKRTAFSARHHSPAPGKQRAAGDPAVADRVRLAVLRQYDRRIGAYKDEADFLERHRADLARAQPGILELREGGLPARGAPSAPPGAGGTDYAALLGGSDADQGGAEDGE